MLNFSITDNGIGIPGDKLEKIFESFTKSDSYPNRKFEGTGLGLSISKKLVALMGGSIGVKSNFQIVFAENGHEALDLYESNKFDLILMDLQMPVMDGYEATARIREMEKGKSKHVPIIALTAKAIKGDRELSLEAGMDGHITKPINIKTLDEEIMKIYTQIVR